MGLLKKEKWQHLLVCLLVLGVLLQSSSCTGSGLSRSNSKRGGSLSKTSHSSSRKVSKPSGDSHGTLLQKSHNEHDIAWIKFKEKYKHKLNFQNPKNNEENQKRAFVTNFYTIKAHKSKSHSYKLEMNQFGTKIFVNNTACIKSNNLEKGICKTKDLKEDDHLPDYVNWSEKYRNPLAKVSDQSSCSSCWAFSTVAVLEGWFARKNITKSLSPQTLLDCRPRHGKKTSCDSGFVSEAFQTLETLRGRIATQEIYPYEITKEKKPCRMHAKSKKLDEREIHKFEGKCVKVDSRNAEKQLKKAVAKYGPVSVSIYTSLSTFTFYSSGVYDDNNCSESALATHAVTVVGYDTRKLKKYWIIKNSWGSGWGENGFMKMEMGRNRCGIANRAFFVMEKDADDVKNDDKGDKSSKCDNSNGVGCGSFAIRRAIVNNCVQVVSFIILYIICL